MSRRYSSFSVSFPPQWEVTAPTLLLSSLEQSDNPLPNVFENSGALTDLKKVAEFDPEPIIGWVAIPIIDPNDPEQLLGTITATMSIGYLPGSANAFQSTELLKMGNFLVRKHAQLEIHDPSTLTLDYFLVQYQLTLSPEVEIFVDAQTPNIHLKDSFEQVFDQIVSTISLES